MKAVIVAGGNAPSKDLFFKEIKDANILIAADSGINTFYNYDITPNIILGDFDSADSEALNYYGQIKRITFKPEKDFTDSELAFNNVLELGATEVVLLGCTGTRLDHTIANLGLLKRGLERNITTSIKDENNYIFLVSQNTTLYGVPGQTISFQAFGGSVNDFNIYNAKYPLYDYNLTLGDGRTVSNEFQKDPIEISFTSGIVMVMYSND
ncbi:thiamine diphosphokinase [Clostridium manihotivorum]|uniref:Thiamine diphosphokinase n=1 Tax=Clostridium manihotivorum TaxID=2320868 RepID=A0A3R5UGL6_9CLOT|nr:thiamine diphosphokinase [Clostridium manihotivorum]QAA33256.1 thiamine diphosphokinase [Clostridium manihotivorum]